MKGIMRKPNKMETIVMGLLDDNFPNAWRFVGDGSLIIDRMCPDFVNINGRKLIIEFFGRAWHKSEEETIRIEKFSQFGYRTLVIWSEELKDKEKLVSRISDWVKAA